MTKEEALKMAEQFGFIKYKDGIDWASNYDNQLINLITALKQPAQEPVALIKHENGNYSPKHQWQGLMDDEVQKCYDKNTGSWVGFYDQIEQALKEKNT